MNNELTEDQKTMATSQAFFLELRDKRRALQIELATFIGEKLYEFSKKNGVNVSGLNVNVEPLFVHGSLDPAHLHVSTHIDIKL